MYYFGLLYVNFFFLHLFIYMKGKVTERRNQRQREAYFQSATMARAGQI